LSSIRSGLCKSFKPLVQFASIAPKGTTAQRGGDSGDGHAPLKVGQP
jgi:hypothetical protein